MLRRNIWRSRATQMSYCKLRLVQKTELIKVLIAFSFSLSAKQFMNGEFCFPYLSATHMRNCVTPLRGTFFCAGKIQPNSHTDLFVLGIECYWICTLLLCLPSLMVLAEEILVAFWEWCSGRQPRLNIHSFTWCSGVSLGCHRKQKFFKPKLNA